jgi:hypothetical protein
MLVIGGAYIYVVSHCTTHSLTGLMACVLVQEIIDNR